MQVSVEAGEGLQRKMSVQVPFETIESEVESRLQSLKGRVKVDGFRPGKVPLKVVKQRYGEQVLYEVAAECIQKSFQDALSKESLKLAGEPVIRNEKIKEGEPLEFTAEFEVFPEVTIAPVTELKLEKIDAEVTDADVGKMLETLRKQQQAWNEVDRASADGDRVIVDFVGKVDGEAFDGGTAKGVSVIIGSGSMIPGFEEHLTGLEKDGSTVFDVPFPEDYSAGHLAGKMAEFSVMVTRVEEPVLPELDDELAKLYGVEEGGLDKLKEGVREKMENELRTRIGYLLKNQVMDRLLEANVIEAPAQMIQEEVTILRNSDRDTGAPARSDEDYQQDAARRVKLGLLLGELVKVSNIQPTPEKVDARLELMSKDYEDPSEFINHYRSNPQLLRGIESLVLEDMVVEWITDQATVSMTAQTFDDVMYPSK